MRRILLITKFRFIGDTLLGIPVFRAVRQQWPDAKITLLTGRSARTLLQNCPYLDNIIEFDPTGANQGTLNFLRLVQRLRRERFSLCLTLNRSFHSALIPALAGIPLRAGFRSEGRTCLLNRGVPYNPDKSEIDCYFDVLRAVAPHVPTHPTLQLWLTDTERETARRRLHDALGFPPDPARLVGMQPGASLPEKRWPAAHFAAVADSLRRTDPAARIILIGGPDERDAAAETLALCDTATLSPITNMVGQSDLRGSLALLAQLGLYLGGDTAICHAANALGVPTLALFGPTNPAKWGAHAAPHRLITSPTGAMDDIPPDLVLQTLAAMRPRPRPTQ